MPTSPPACHRRGTSRALLAALALGAAACTSPTDQARTESDACPQTYEFGNHGCARVVAVVDEPPKPWPERVRWDVRAVPARPATDAFATFSPAPGPGPVPLQLTRWMQPPADAGDTLSVWIVARLLDDTPPYAVGVPLPTFAADSVLRVLRFAEVGRVPVVDSVHLTPRAP